MEVTLTMYLIVLPLVFLAAFIDAIGGGGGLISLPAYYLAGLPPHLAAGTNKMSACFGSFTATLTFLKKGKLLLLPSLCAVLGALPGAYIGTEIVKHLNPETVRLIMFILLPIVAVFMVLRRNKDYPVKPVTRKTLVLCLLIGLVVGFYDGFFGPGTGTFYILLFTRFCGMETVTASGSAKPANFASNVASLTSYLFGGHVLFALAIPAMVCSSVGGILGSRIAIKKGAKFIRYIMLVVVFLILVKLIIDWLWPNLLS